MERLHIRFHKMSIEEEFCLTKYSPVPISSQVLLRSQILE